MKTVSAKKIHANLSLQDLRELARKDETTTEYGSASYVTKVRNRSKKQTYIVEGIPLGVRQQGMSPEKAKALAAEVQNYLKEREVLQIDRTMGSNRDYTLACRLYITKDYARIAHEWHASLFPAQNGRQPDLVSVYVPEWPERIIFTSPKEGWTYILGTDYFGEAKKSFLRKAMYHVKTQKGGIGLHAGSKLVRVKGVNGKTNEVGFIMFGLSGTGKTSLTMHDHGLGGDEGIRIRQDDVILMGKDGYCFGTEDGFFIKTEGLEPSQTVLWKAATSGDAIFENIWVEPNGRVDFLNYTHTTNGRGVVKRRDILHTDDSVDLPKANKIIFITRRDDVVPPVARLNPAQAAAYFMLGESIETSAGDPTKAGQAKREVGTNPFIVGPETDEGHFIAGIIGNNPDMECYLRNTGRVGKKAGFEGEKITVRHSTEIMKQLARGGISWEKDPDWGYEVPVKAEGLDLAPLMPRKLYSQGEYDELVGKLRRERVEWLAQFPGLAPEIKKAVEK
jgi:phosphoenolpyruvate carboxykinase (ATP)